ncbi:general secretion pathway protein H [Marichromatium purpuratum 984]|uniref:Type II secretion system protein H n=1 Tax=Marichromatium purpuratum 984 TaxID=765910 RepID=W0DZW4_MARPU|nr:GspH/FimT family pseudopilin [Marichromatium purpuratum]AHF02803.1 general secretion pathway protein H [Marichromatium purpuratum 984]
MKVFQPFRDSSRQQGVTLLELIVTVSILTIILSVAIPSFREIVATNRIAVINNDLLEALHVARSEAIKRGTRVTVCKSTTTSSNSPACATDDSGWENGWIIFSDRGTRGQIDGNDQIISVHEQNIPAVTITTGNSFKDFISYLPSGFSQGSGGSTEESFLIKLQGKARKIEINFTGRIRSCDASDNSSC